MASGTFEVSASRILVWRKGGSGNAFIGSVFFFKIFIVFVNSACGWFGKAFRLPARALWRAGASARFSCVAFHARLAAASAPWKSWSLMLARLVDAAAVCQVAEKVVRRDLQLEQKDAA